MSDTGTKVTYDVRLNGVEACTANADATCDAVANLDLVIQLDGGDIKISSLGGTKSYAAFSFSGGGALDITYWSDPGPDGAGNSVGATLASVTVIGIITSTTATTAGRLFSLGGFISNDVSDFEDVPESLAGSFGGVEADGGFGGTIPAGYEVSLGQFIVHYTPSCAGVAECSENGVCTAPDTCTCAPDFTGPIAAIPTRLSSQPCRTGKRRVWPCF